MIGQVVDEGRLHLNPDAVGVVGVSYGGGQSWLALVNPSFSSPHGAAVRIRTAVPIVPWTDLVYSLLPNGRPEDSLRPAGSAKLSYINGLYFGGLRTSATRPYPNYPEYLTAWQAWLNANEPNEADPVYQQIVDGAAGYRSIWWQDAFWRDAAANRVPVFQVQGLNDDLFPLSEAKRMLLRLPPGYPIASYFGDLGHPRAANKLGERDYVVSLIRAWFAYYLRGLGTEPEHVIHAAVTRPRNVPFDAQRDVFTANSYAALGPVLIAREFPGSRVLINPVTDPYSGFYWDPLIMEAAAELRPLPAPPDAAVALPLAVYTVNVGELTSGQTLLIAGQPSVSLRASTAALRVQLDLRLIDVAPDGSRQLITRGTFLLDGPTDRDIVIPTYGNVWEAPPDHTLRLEITNLDSPYLAPSRVPSLTQISAVRLEVPTR
jgi:hypothetical protein